MLIGMNPLHTLTPAAQSLSQPSQNFRNFFWEIFMNLEIETGKHVPLKVRFLNIICWTSSQVLVEKWHLLHVAVTQQITKMTNSCHIFSLRKVWPVWVSKSFCVGFPARTLPLQSSSHSTKLSGINHWGPALTLKLWFLFWDHVQNLLATKRNNCLGKTSFKLWDTQI